MRCCRKSSQSRLRSSSCSLFHVRACLTPSPFGRGERNSKHFVGLSSGTLSVWGEGRRSVDLELSEHGSNVGGRGGCRDRSRYKGWGCGTERSEGSKIDDSDGVMVSPSPQSQIEEEEKLHTLQKYARDFKRRHTTDAQDFHWDSEDEDYGLAIGRLVIT
jgi:hypothetical protein